MKLRFLFLSIFMLNSLLVQTAFAQSKNSRDSDAGILSNTTEEIPQLSLLATDKTKRNRYNLTYEYNNPDSQLFFQVLRSQIYYQDSESTEESNELRRAKDFLTKLLKNFNS